MGLLSSIFGGQKVDTSATTLKPLGVKLIDVRSAGEFRSGHVSGARNIDVSSPGFERTISSLNARHTYLVYCQSGSRSARAAATMRRGGLTVLDGGGLRKMTSQGWTLGA
jgi:phage shock protein E